MRNKETLVLFVSCITNLKVIYLEKCPSLLAHISPVSHICDTHFFVLFPDVLFHLMEYFWIASDYSKLEYEVFDDLNIFTKELVPGHLVQK